MFRRVIAGFVALLALPTAVLVAAPASSAAGSCTLTVPHRIVIGRPYMGVTTRMSGDCAQGGVGAWELYHPSRGWQDFVSFDGTTSEVWDVYSSNTIGLHTWRPAGAYPADFSSSLTQNSPTSDVRLATAAWISSSRSGSVVTLKATSLLYSTDRNAYFKRSAAGMFQYRERGTTTWRNLKSVWTTSAGTATMSYRYSATRDYRFALYTTPISWDLASATTVR